MKFPVSVIIPTIESRKDFLEQRCLSSVRANGETEVIVVDGPGNGSRKRNLGVRRATQPYLLFVDDDCILKWDCVEKMFLELDRFTNATFVYSDYERILAPGVQHPSPAGRITAGEFDCKRLRVSNYINTTSMIRAVACPDWDEMLERFQDWDFWLTVVGRGHIGRYIPEALYELWQIDISVTAAVKANPYVEMIGRKHGLNWM